MRRRLLLVLCGLAALAFVSVAAGAGSAAKVKLKLDFASAVCSVSCNPGSIAVRMVGGGRCRPFLHENCSFKVRRGTTIVLFTTADPPLASHHWGADCSGVDDDECVVVMDSDKTYRVFWTAP